MDTNTLKYTIQIIFLVVVLFLGLISLLSAYALIRYGRTPSITILLSLVFGGVFLLGAFSAYLSLTNIF